HEPWALDAAVTHIDTLPPDRAARVLWGIGHAFNDAGQPLPDPLIDAAARLINRVEYAQKFRLYDQLAQLGAGEDPRVRAALHGVLDDPDDRRFVQAVEFYDANFLWLRDAVPADAWLRWAVLLSRSSAPQSQLRAAQLLGDMPERIHDAVLPEALARLANSTNASVRGEALDAAAGYARVADDPIPYEQVLIALTEDANETLARRAWITLGLLNPLSGFSADWRSAEPAIAEAMLWAVLKTNPDHTKPALEAMETEGYRAAGTFALNHWRQPLGPPSEEHLVLQHVAALDPAQYETAINRQIHVTKQYLHGEWTVLPDALFSAEAEWSIHYPRLWAAMNWVTTYPPAPPYDGSEASQTGLIAHLDGYLHHGSPVAWDHLDEINADWPDIAVLLASVFVQDEPITLYGDSFNADAAAARDLAIIAALYSRETEQWIDQALRDRRESMLLSAALLAGMTDIRPALIEGDSPPDLSAQDLLAMPDAQLADLGLRRVDALTTLLDIAETAPDRDDRYEQIAMLKLALWMRGDLADDFIPEAEAMLEDDRLPTSTVLMCLLHMQRPAALYYLFDPPAGSEQELDLYDLFVNQRWWHVFSRLVPDRDLDLWLWGDPGAQAFQFEVMRQWVQANRWRLENGWWPGPTDAAGE
ncbi:MAG: hypothetical protein ACIAXF_01570, partial [Phycisphaerales bacterium JB063]